MTLTIDKNPIFFFFYQDPRFNQEIDLKTGYHTRSILCMPITDHYHGEVLIFCYYKWRGQAENPFLQVIQSCAALCSSVGVEVIVGRVLIMLGCSYTVRRGTLGDCQHHNTTEKITNTTSPQKKVEETPMSQWTFLPIRRPY